MLDDLLAKVDILHLFGSRPEFVAVAEEARRRGVRVVVSTIAWFDLAGYWRGGKTLAGRVAACGRFLARAACPRLPSWRRRLYHAADLLLPNSKAEAWQLVRYFGVRPERIRVVPNGADPRFAAARPEAFAERYGEVLAAEDNEGGPAKTSTGGASGTQSGSTGGASGTQAGKGMVPSPPAPLPRAGEGRNRAVPRPEPLAPVGVPDFVLCPARIEPRKNQLDLIRAVRGTGLRLVILGDAVPGHEAYEARCRREAGPEVTFLGRIDHDDPLLASGHAACRCLALASWFETPGLAAIEAAMSGTPLVLPEGGAAREYFGDWAQYVRPGRIGEIRRALLRAAARDRNPELARWTVEHYTWAAAARATHEAYMEVL
ncbi:MAG: glycosyltransferase [Pirellulales bacterium]|nr:glycosyltransferase [Pirellulales bacterium]